jgi:hypothetical protein
MSKGKSLSSVVLPNALIMPQFIQQTPEFHNLHCPNKNAKHNPKYFQHQEQEHITQCQALLQLTTKNHHNNAIVLNLKKTKETNIQSLPFTRSFHQLLKVLSPFDFQKLMYCFIQLGFINPIYKSHLEHLQRCTLCNLHNEIG